jgi:MFS family permease
MFVDDMLQDLGITRSEVSWTWMVALLASSSFLPVAGYIFDKFGARFLLLLNIVPLVLSTALVSRTTGTWSLGACFFGMRLFGPEVCELLAYCMVNMWFVKHRARAASMLMTVDSSLLATPPLLLGLKNAVGWRTSFQVLGLLQAILLVVCWIFLRDRPEDLGLQPDGLDFPPQASPDKSSEGGSGNRPGDMDGSPAAKSEAGEEDLFQIEDVEHQPEKVAKPAFGAEKAQEILTLLEEEDWPFQEIVQERSFCMLVINFGLYRIFRAGMNMHIVNVFEEKGSNPATASFVYSVITAGSIFATLTFPKICHLFSNKIRLMGYVYCLGAAAMGSAGIMGPSNHWLMCWVFAALYGVFWGVVGTISGTIFADLFGRSSVGMTRSILGWISTLASGCGTLVFSAAKEHLGDYDLAILPLAGTVALLALALVNMNHPERLQKRSEADASLNSIVGKPVFSLVEAELDEEDPKKASRR